MQLPGYESQPFQRHVPGMYRKSFVEVLSDTRMEKARELLETTSLKTYQVAEKTGFGDPHYFSLAFKKATGKTPTEYAKEKRR